MPVDVVKRSTVFSKLHFSITLKNAPNFLMICDVTASSAEFEQYIFYQKSLTNIKI